MKETDRVVRWLKMRIKEGAPGWPNEAIDAIWPLVRVRSGRLSPRITAARSARAGKAAGREA
jgi:hypothetical protein